MIGRIVVERLRRRALITSAGWSVVLIETDWPPAPVTGGVRPALIASVAKVNAPALSPAAGGALLPAAVSSTVAVGQPTIARSSASAVSPSTIGPGSAVGAPAIEGQPTINNTRGDSQQSGNDVAGFATRAQALDARLTALGY